MCSEDLSVIMLCFSANGPLSNITACLVGITRIISNLFCQLPYIANCSRWKSFAVVELNCNLLENIRGCTIVLCGQILLHRGTIAITPEKFGGYRSIHDNFPPRTIYNIQYVFYWPVIMATYFNGYINVTNP